LPSIGIAQLTYSEIIGDTHAVMRASRQKKLDHFDRLRGVSKSRLENGPSLGSSAGVQDRKTFEVEVDYVYRHIPEGEWLKRHLRLRLIAVWRHDIEAHRLYLTSADPSQFKAGTAAAVYTLRWEIELLFREL